MFGQDGWPVALTARSPVPLCTQTGSQRGDMNKPLFPGVTGCTSSDTGPTPGKFQTPGTTRVNQP